MLEKIIWLILIKFFEKYESLTFTYKVILPDPDISGLNKQTGDFAYFEYSI